MVGINNPFNIRHNGQNHWLGLNGSTCGFCNFDSLDYGIRAACILIMKSYRKKNILTISEIIHRFAPPSENNTDKYVDFVCSKLGCFPFDIPVRSAFPHLLHAISVYEGNPISAVHVYDVIKKFNIIPNKCK